MEVFSKTKSGFNPTKKLDASGLNFDGNPGQAFDSTTGSGSAKDSTRIRIRNPDIIGGARRNYLVYLYIKVVDRDGEKSRDSPRILPYRVLFST